MQAMRYMHGFKIWPKRSCRLCKFCGRTTSPCSRVRWMSRRPQRACTNINSLVFPGFRNTKPLFRLGALALRGMNICTFGKPRRQRKWSNSASRQRPGRLPTQTPVAPPQRGLADGKPKPGTKATLTTDMAEPVTSMCGGSCKSRGQLGKPVRCSRCLGRLRLRLHGLLCQRLPGLLAAGHPGGQKVNRNHAPRPIGSPWLETDASRTAGGLWALWAGCSKAKAHKALRRVASPPVAGLSKTCSCGEPPRPGCCRARQVPQVLNAGQLPHRCIRKSSGRSSRPRSIPRTMREHELLKESPGRARDEAILELHSLRSAARQPPQLLQHSTSERALHVDSALSWNRLNLSSVTAASPNISMLGKLRQFQLRDFHTKHRTCSSGPPLQRSAAGKSG